LESFLFWLAVPTITRTAGGLGFAAIGGNILGREVPQPVKTTRWNRVLRTRFGKPNIGRNVCRKQQVNRCGDKWWYLYRK
jgi:hypothetical protein